jgi:transcription elongation factor Elf1
VASCLSCEELEQKICNLSEEITEASCTASITKEGDTFEDRTPGLNAKIDLMKTYTDLYTAKKCGSSTDLFEFVHVPCVTPVSCIGDVCISTPLIRRNRRYRR